MGRLLWPVGLAVTFALGLTAGGLARGILPRAPEAEQLQAIVDRQELQIQALQAELRGQGAAAGRATPGPGRWGDMRQASLTGAAESAPRAGRRWRPGGPPQGEPQDDLSSPARGTRPTVASTVGVETALQRINKYFDETSGSGGGPRWQKMRDLVADLRAMGEPATDALLRVLASASSSDERRTAAQLLGELQAARALPMLQGILEQDGDVLVRRAAAAALRRLDTPDSIPIMQALLSDPGEDRFVRLSAAFGLAQLGNPLGVPGLVMIFDETNGDGRGRDGAFRAIVALNDDRVLPFMREVAASQAELNYRIQAIRFLAAQGDRQSLPALQQIMQTPTEQPSIRDAATQAYTTIAGR